MSVSDPCLIRSRGPSGEPVVRLGMPLVDDYLEFLEGRCRPNTVLAAAYDLRVFFTRRRQATGGGRGRRTCWGSSPPSAPAAPAAQPVQPVDSRRRAGRGGDEHGGAAAVDVSGFFAYLQARGDIAANPVPRGLPTRRERSRPGQGVPLTRRTRRLPRILTPAEVDALTAALRTHRDRAMVAAMVLGGLRRCEVLGLRLEDLRVAERRVFIAEGKGGHQRLVPVSARFFTAVAAYLEHRATRRRRHRPGVRGAQGTRTAGSRCRRKGLDEILAGARRRAGLAHATCHELRHTCLTRLREAGMALEAVQAQAGHASIESTRIYLHLADDWLASQYRKAAEVIDAQLYAGHPATADRAGERVR